MARLEQIGLREMGKKIGLFAGRSNARATITTTSVPIPARCEVEQS